MTVFKKLSLQIVCLLSIPLVAQAVPSAQLTLRCAERVPGVCTAPAWVHVDGSETTDSNQNVRPFHDLKYHISYGDSGSYATGTWDTGWRGESRNEEHSPVGGHVYESAGTFTVTLTVTDSSGIVSTDSESITIQDADLGWPANVTRCVSSSGNFAGCPSAAVRMTSADYDATLQTTGGTRTLYRCGDTFTASSNPTIQNSPTNGSLVSGFGNCQDGDNPARVTVTTTEIHTSGVGGWRFRDMQYTHMVNSDEVRSFNVTAGDIHHFLFFRSESLETAGCPGANSVAQHPTYFNLNALVDWKCTNTKQTTGTSWRTLWYQGRYGGLIGGDLTCDAPSALYWRTMGLNKVLVAHINHTVPQGSGCVLAQHFRNSAPESGRIQDKFVIRDQRVFDESPETFRTLALCYSPSCGGATGQNTSQNIIVEENFTTYGPGKPNATVVGIHVKSDNVTIRNNIWDLRGQPIRTGGQSLVVIANETFVPDNVHVYNNTAIRDENSGSWHVVNNSSSGSGHIARNNLLYDMNSADNTLTAGTVTNSNNLHLNAGEEGCPFAGANGSCTFSAPSLNFNPREFFIRNSGGSRGLVLNQGFAFPDTSFSGQRPDVYRDAFGNCRSANGNVDIGAHEFGATPCAGGSGADSTAPAAPTGLSIQ